MTAESHRSPRFPYIFTCKQSCLHLAECYTLGVETPAPLLPHLLSDVLSEVETFILDSNEFTRNWGWIYARVESLGAELSREMYGLKPYFLYCWRAWGAAAEAKDGSAFLPALPWKRLCDGALDAATKASAVLKALEASSDEDDVHDDRFVAKYIQRPSTEPALVVLRKGAQLCLSGASDEPPGIVERINFIATSCFDGLPKTETQSLKPFMAGTMEQTFQIWTHGYWLQCELIAAVEGALRLELPLSEIFTVPFGDSMRQESRTLLELLDGF